MGAARAWVSVSGQTPIGSGITVQGEEALRTVYFDPTFARVTKDTSSTPPRAVISAAPELVAMLADYGARIVALEAIVAELDAFVDKVITEFGNEFHLKNPQGDICIILGQAGGQPAIKFFVNAPPIIRPSVSSSSPTLADDLAIALQNTGMIALTP